MPILSGALKSCGRIGAVVSATLVITACGAASAASERDTATAPAPASTPARTSETIHHCAGAQLTVAMRHGGGAAGTVGAALVFTNVGASKCTLSGWPTMIAITKTGTKMRLERATSTMFGPYGNLSRIPTVTLKHDGRAVAFFTSNDVPMPATRRCIFFKKLSITAPGTHRKFLISAWLSAAADTDLPFCGSRPRVSMVVSYATASRSW